MFCILKDERPNLRLLFFSGAISMVVFELMAFFIAAGGGSSLPKSLAHNAGSDIAPSEFIQGQVERQQVRDAGLLRFQTESASSTLDTAERGRVLNAVIKNLKDHYFDHAIGQMMAHELRLAERSGYRDAITDGAVLANLLTRQTRAIAHDMHLEVVTVSSSARYFGWADTRSACTLSRSTATRKLRPRKGRGSAAQCRHIKLNWFPDPAVCGSKAKAVMASLINVDAVIFDLRNNAGGAADMVQLISSYLFDHPAYWYNPREVPTWRSLDAIAGSRK